MIKLQISLLPTKNPWKNFLTEESILTCDREEKDLNIVHLLFYENLPSIILGKSLKFSEEIFLHKQDIPILRRMSGGGSVVHFSGNLNYSLIFSLKKFPKFFSIHDSYQLILDSLCNMFYNKGFILERNGLSDLCVMQKGTHRKISGNSQVRKKGYLMHHGTFLYQTNHRYKIAYYLKMPSKQPDYRKKRRHSDFIILTSLKISRSELIRIMSEAFQKLFGADMMSMRPVQ